MIKMPEKAFGSSKSDSQYAGIDSLLDRTLKRGHRVHQQDTQGQGGGDYLEFIKNEGEGKINEWRSQSRSEARSFWGYLASQQQTEPEPQRLELRVLNLIFDVGWTWYARGTHPL